MASPQAPKFSACLKQAKKRPAIKRSQIRPSLIVNSALKTMATGRCVLMRACSQRNRSRLRLNLRSDGLVPSHSLGSVGG